MGGLQMVSHHLDRSVRKFVIYIIDNRSGILHGLPLQMQDVARKDGLADHGSCRN